MLHFPLYSGCSALRFALQRFDVELCSLLWIFTFSFHKLVQQIRLWSVTGITQNFPRSYVKLIQLINPIPTITAAWGNQSTLRIVSQIFDTFSSPTADCVKAPFHEARKWFSCKFDGLAGISLGIFLWNAPHAKGPKPEALSGPSVYLGVESNRKTNSQ